VTQSATLLLGIGDVGHALGQETLDRA
jgi:hypothetical protein